MDRFNPVTTRLGDTGMKMPVTKYGLRTETEIERELAGEEKERKRFRYVHHFTTHVL
jgi:hypothetical protein